jgi:quinol monooxygenase YgiN
MMSDPTALVIHATYHIHPDDVGAFADAVRPHIAAHAALPGCVYYAFAPDLLDPTLFHLVEGWADQESLEGHMLLEDFQEALRVIGNGVRILDRDAQIYTVAKQEPIAMPSRVDA